MELFVSPLLYKVEAILMVLIVSEGSVFSSCLPRLPGFTSVTTDLNKNLASSSWPPSTSFSASSGLDLYNSYPSPTPSCLSFPPSGIVRAAPRPLIHTLRSSGGDLVRPN